MNKKEIRVQYRQMRSSLLQEEREKKYNSLLHQFSQLKLADINYLHHYLAVTEQYEIDIDAIIKVVKINFPNIIQAVPVMKGDDMISVLYRNGMPVKKNEWGIQEPIDQIPVLEELIDCVLIPLLAFDKQGNRVGYGKGCYDRFLAKCRKDLIKIGFSFFEPLDSIDDTDKFDIPLNLCITPDRIYEFG